MKNRFWGNRTKTDCAPIAILNALRWLKYPVNLRSYRDICIRLGYTSGRGTSHRDIHRVLKAVPRLKVSRKRVFSGTRIAEFLHGHKTAVLVSYRAQWQRRGHIYLIVGGRKGRGFINLFSKPTAYWVKKKPPSQVLRTKNGFPVAWFVEKI
jgi:hypothetical protein